MNSWEIALTVLTFIIGWILGFATCFFEHLRAYKENGVDFMLELLGEKKK